MRGAFGLPDDCDDLVKPGCEGESTKFQHLCCNLTDSGGFAVFEAANCVGDLEECGWWVVWWSVCGLYGVKEGVINFKVGV